MLVIEYASPVAWRLSQTRSVMRRLFDFLIAILKTNKHNNKKQTNNNIGKPTQPTKTTKAFELEIRW